MPEFLNANVVRARVENIIAELDQARATGRVLTYGAVQDLLRTALAEAMFEVPEDTEVHEHRTYTPAICWMCGTHAVYHVTDEQDDELFACDTHKWAAFS